MWADDPLTVSQMIAPCSEAVEDRGLREHVDSASDATTEETETIDEVIPLHSTVVLKERLNQRVAHFLATLTVEDLKKYNPPSKHHCKTENDFRLALKKLNAFLSTFVGKEDGTQRTYRYARGKGFGLMFCSCSVYTTTSPYC